LYTTDPNPRVGCVLVRDGEVVGSGWHQRAGGPHAEVLALQEAGDRARGAIAYVTLEPCCHHGKTPPCSDALIQAGVQRVIAAMEDPNPRVAGQGLAQLQQAGIEVETGLMQAQAEALNPGFTLRMRNGRPLVRCKLAMSLDGRTAAADPDQHARDLIEQLLFTSPGERVHRPDFGTGLRDLVFAPNSPELASATQLLVQGALQQGLAELIQVDAVEVESEESTLTVTVRYVVRRTQEPRVAQFEQEVGK